MTPLQLAQAEDLFFRIRAHPQQRGELLSAEPDTIVRAEVLALLGPVPAQFLGTPVFGADILRAMAGTEPDPMVGGSIGPYHVERLLGAGGMGAVYLANRADGAFEQRVAIKVVKRGMDTDEILDRFRTERRTLANLNHPNIAGLHDGGSLPDGRPYLVMEFVDGTPLNTYLRDKQLNTTDRLRLFIAVCRAVQFAHQNLVIHRDLKPSNILVTADGTPKLLDFGISKVLAHGSDSGTVTSLDERRLTPEYASPEQVEGLPVTTSSDIYSLGVILYEILAGRPPYQFKTRTRAEIQRIVNSAPPPPPSTVTGDPAHKSPLDARLRRELRGDLDTIVLMAMRKEPARRYASAEQLASDIDRYLRGLPVIARRDTLAYRTGKFVRRHAVACSLAAVILMAVLAGITAVVWQAGVARRQRDDAFIARDQAEATTKFFRDMIESANPFTAGPDMKVRDVLDQAAARLGTELSDRPLVQASLRSSIGTAYLGLGEYEKAEKEIRGAYEQRLKLVGPRHHDTAESMNDLATLLYNKHEFPEAERLLREALSIFQTIRGDHNFDIARVQSNLGPVLRSQGKAQEAADALTQAIQIWRKESGPRTLDLAESLNNYGNALRSLNRLADAEKAVAESMEIRTALLGPESPLVAQSTANLAVLISSQGEPARAEPLFLKAIALELKGLGPNHPDRSHTLNSYAGLLRAKKDLAASEFHFREALRIREAAYLPADPRVIATRLGLIEALVDEGKSDEARAQLESALSATAQVGVDSALRTRVITRAAAFYRARGEETRAKEIESATPSR